MRMDNMKPGKPLELYVSREGYRYRLLSKVEGCSIGKVYISLIASGSRVFRFLSTDQLELIYKDGDRMWKWHGLKGSVALLDGERVHCLESLKEGEVYNRREAFRVHLGVELVITKLVPKKQEEEAGNMPEDDLDDYERIKVPSVLKDLSETGAGIYTNDKMDIGTMIEIEIPAKDGVMRMLGNVVRMESGDFGKYREFYGCGFSQVDRRLGKYLFALQRAQLQKERGER